ncbi:MAG TPA: S8 family serine peptidase [Candidatus Obscuribacterales bacterium]
MSSSPSQCQKGKLSSLFVAFFVLIFFLIAMAPAYSQEADCRPETLLVMPKPGVTQQQVEDALKPYNAKIVRTLSGGSLTTYVIDTCECGGTLDQMKSTLQSLSVFQNVQKDYKCAKTQGVGLWHRFFWGGFFNRPPFPPPPLMAPNDPAYPSQYELRKLRIRGAWLVGAKGQNQTIAVLDTGCNRVSELGGDKLLAGFNAYQFVIDGQMLPGDHDTDPEPLGHGTAVATTLAAHTNNSTGTASPAYESKIYPVIISDPTGTAYDSTIIVGILLAQQEGIRLVNLSFQAPPPNTFANQTDHAILHAYMKQYHDSYNGLVFNCAGNDSYVDPNPRTNYLIMVSASDRLDQISFFSNTGTPLWFAAPGVSTQCTDKSGNTVFVNGTSFSSPLTCAVAAQVLSRFPNLTNDQLTARMARTARRFIRGYTPSKYGHGVPNARWATWFPGCGITEEEAASNDD